MTRTLRLTLFVTACLLLGIALSGSAAQTGERGTPAATADLDAMQGANTHVIVVLNVEQSGRMAFEHMSGFSQEAVIAQAQEAVLFELGLTRSPIEKLTRYTSLPLLALEVDAEQRAVLEASAWVTGIQESQWRVADLTESVAKIGMTGPNGAWNLGADGEGQVVAVLDTGIDKTHPFLTGKVIREACFGTNQAGGDYVASTFCPGALVNGDSDGPDTAIPCNAAIVGCSHGTILAGIVAGKNGLDGRNGVAKESDLISVQVFSRIDSATVCGPLGTSVCILAADVDILAALDYIYSIRGSYAIAAVNLSLGSGEFTSRAACDSANPGYVAAVNQLHSAGIAVIASSGNQSKLFAINAPACVTKVISVAASTDTDTIASFSNTASFLTFLAPGQEIISSLPGGGYNNSTGINNPGTTTDDYLFPANGTSFAAPHVAGAYAALRSYRPTASLNLIRDSLNSTAVNLTDNGGTFKRIQVDAAARAMIVPDQPVLYAPVQNQAFSEGPITFKWRPGADTDEYVLKVYNPGGAQLARVTVPHGDCTVVDAEFNTSGTICQVDVSAVYVDDAVYTWDVNAKNIVNGTAALSETWSFQFDTPGKAELLFPADSVWINSPTELFQFQWSEVALATSYSVTLFDRATKANLAVYIFQEGDICVAQVCTAPLMSDAQNLLADDKEYRWFVTSISDDGTSKSKVRKVFTQFPAAPLLIQPAANGVFNDPASPFIWSEVADATSYKVIIKDVASNKTVISETALISTRTFCDNGQCEFVLSGAQIDVLKPNKEYKWRVTSKNALGSTPTSWSRFTTAGPGPTALILPVNGIVFYDWDENTFQWATLTSVETYKLVLKDLQTGKRVFKVKIDANTCDASCVFTPSPAQQSQIKNLRTFRWWVVSQTGLGSSNSLKILFSTEYPGKPVLLEPTDNLRIEDKSELVQFRWTPAQAEVAVTYRLKVFRTDKTSDVILNTVLTPGVDITCDVDDCTYAVPNDVRNALKDGKDYKWQVKAISAAGSVTSSKFIFKARF